MSDCVTVKIWKTLCDRVAEVLPGTRVVRSYNAVAQFQEVQNSDVPVVFVTLEGKGRERISNRKVFDVLDFSIWITKYVPEQEEAAVIAAMDECLGRLDTFADAFSLRRITTDGISFILSDAESEGDKAFDLNDFIEYSLFSVMFGVRAKFAREVE